MVLAILGYMTSVRAERQLPTEHTYRLNRKNPSKSIEVALLLKIAQVFAKQRREGQSNQTSNISDQAVRNSLRDHPIGYVFNSHQIDSWYEFREDVTTFEPLIDSLEQAFSNSVFCCGGNLHIPDAEVGKFVLKVQPEETEGDENWKEFQLDQILPEELLEYCNPSPFGDLKEMKTVLDPEVRLAYEIETDRFDFGYVDYRDETKFLQSRVLPGKFSVDKHIQEELTPGRRMTLNRKKLNVYGKGGFFKSHVDSPSHDNMIGTLVICLPSPHKGGELIVRHDGLEHVFDFSKNSDDPCTFQWAAFCADCVHEVKPVTEGFRVTITYSINLRERYSLMTTYYERENPVPVQEHFEISAKCPSRSFAKVDCELQNLPGKLGNTAPEYVGFILKHKYTLPGLQPNMLKGEDKALLDYLTSQGWECQLKNILSRFMTTLLASSIEEDGRVVDYEYTYKEIHEIYEFKPVETSHFLPESSDRFSSRHHMFSGNFHRWRVGIPFIEIYRKPDDSKLVRKNDGHSSWVGNEMHDVDVDKIYLDAALVVHLRKL